MTNGERIRYLREKNGFTQKEVANRLGVESAAISKYELDMREPNIEALKKLATLFNVSIDYLLGRTPDILVSEVDRDIIEIPALKRKYNLLKGKIDKVKEEYTNINATNIAINELCAGVGKTTYGESKTNPIISLKEIEDLFENIENAKEPKPQILLKSRDIENWIIIVEMDSFDDEEIPIEATERLWLYSAKLSKEYNVLGLAILIEKDEICKLNYAGYQKQGDKYYTQLHLPRTVLTAVEYIDVMSRL